MVWYAKRMTSKNQAYTCHMKLIMSYTRFMLEICWTSSCHKNIWFICQDYDIFSINGLVLYQPPQAYWIDMSYEKINLTRRLPMLPPSLPTDVRHEPLLQWTFNSPAIQTSKVCVPRRAGGCIRVHPSPNRNGAAGRFGGFQNSNVDA